MSAANPGLRLPSEGVLAPFMYAQQVEAVFMVLRIALLATGGAVARSYLRVNRGEAPDPA